MKFGEVALDEAVGGILAHKLYDDAGKLILNKGHVISEADIVRLRELGRSGITVTQLSAADLHEDAAAEAHRRGGGGRQCATARARRRTGQPDRGRARRLACQCADARTDQQYLRWHHHRHLREYSLVERGEMVALVKVVPFGVPAARVVDVERIAAAGAACAARAAAAGEARGADRLRHGGNARAPAAQLSMRRCGGGLRAGAAASARADLPRTMPKRHRSSDPRTQADAADLILVASISAIIDREDVVPSALAAGRRQHHAARRAGGSRARCCCWDTWAMCRWWARRAASSRPRPMSSTGSCRACSAANA